MLVLALTSGVVAALLALKYLRERTTPLMASEPRKANIVLSTRNLPVGSVVTERDVKVVSWPGEAVPSRLYPVGEGCGGPRGHNSGGRE